MSSAYRVSPPSPLEKRRRGCLGCLGQCVLALLLGALLLLAIFAVFTPWAFYLGGSFHLVPGWQGWGTLHTKSGNYVVFVRMEPTSRGSRMYPASNLTGLGYICTPRGERFRMRLGGGMRKQLNLDTNGEHISLYMHYRPWNWQFLNDDRPHLELRGQWQNPDLVMDDHGSIPNNFEPDGSVYRGHSPTRPYSTEGVPITLVPGSYSDFEAACRTVKRAD